MRKITPHLWYDTQAKEAAELYAATFNESKIISVTQIHDTPSGSVDIVTFEVMGKEFMAINAGPLFKFNPSISFFISLHSEKEVERVWDKLADGGSVLMPIGEYPFSKKYGWIADRYGLSWQIGYSDQPSAPPVLPSLLFVGEQCGRAEEAIRFYTNVFPDSSVTNLIRWGKGEEPEKEGAVKYATFTIEGNAFSAMDSAREHDFAFNEAISFMVYCDTQEEIDFYWEKLSAVPEAEQCGWLKDKFGVSWQIVPTVMDAMLASKDKAQVARVTEAFLKMKKFDLKKLQDAYENK